jgi:hypothetical protein
VRSEEATDYCTTGECSAKRITVVGNTESVEYVLDCVEVVAHKPSLHYTPVCSHVHANEEYAVKIMDTAISFGGDEPTQSNEPIHFAYNIVSEKEMPKRK